MSQELPWSHAVTDIPAGGLSSQRAASPGECAAVAAALELPGCQSIAAKYRITALGGGRYRLAGEVTAELEQACIVTLEPVAARLAERFDVQFWPEGEAEPQLEGEVEALSAAEIETIEGGRIDAGRIVFETIAAGLDPFPRKEGAALDRSEAGGEGAPGPFAALEKLRGKT